MTANNEPHSTSDADKAFRTDQTQDDFEMEFYGRILEISGQHLDVLRRQAELLSRQGNHKGAVGLDRRLAQLCPNDPIAHYNLTCSLAMTTEIRAAIQTLRRAIELGYDDLAHIETDPDLDALRDDPQFNDLLRQLGLPYQA